MKKFSEIGGLIEKGGGGTLRKGGGGVHIVSSVFLKKSMLSLLSKVLSGKYSHLV